MWQDLPSRLGYKTQSPSIRHIGPMAQDFYAVFGVGNDDKYINSVDADGVALVAIQGLYQMIQDKDAQIRAQQQHIETMEAEIANQQNYLATLEARLTAMEKRLLELPSSAPTPTGETR